MDGIYLDDATYDALVDKLLNNDLCPGSGRVEADQIKTALGEIGNIWPASVVEAGTHD